MTGVVGRFGRSVSPTLGGWQRLRARREASVLVPPIKTAAPRVYAFNRPNRPMTSVLPPQNLASPWAYGSDGCRQRHGTYRAVCASPLPTVRISGRRKGLDASEVLPARASVPGRVAPELGPCVCRRA